MGRILDLDLGREVECRRQKNRGVWGVGVPVCHFLLEGVCHLTRILWGSQNACFVAFSAHLSISFYTVIRHGQEAALASSKEAVAGTDGERRGHSLQSLDRLQKS